MIQPVVFVISEEVVVFQKNGIVPDVRATDCVEHLRPDVPMVFLVTFDLAGVYSNDESKALHVMVSPASRNRDAADSGVISRCGVPSISNPTMNFRMFAERNRGG